MSRKPKCIFDRLPPGPVDTAALEAMMEDDSLAAVGRALDQPRSDQPAASFAAATPAASPEPGGQVVLPKEDGTAEVCFVHDCGDPLADPADVAGYADVAGCRRFERRDGTAGVVAGSAEELAA